MKTVLIVTASALVASTASAQLAVNVSPVKVTGQKAVVQLGMRNNLAEKVESARAAVFLLDEHGKLVGQATRWVIGGSQDKPGLAAGATNAFYFIIASDKPFPTTNLAAKVSFNRIVMEGGKIAVVTESVQIKDSEK